MGSLSISRRPPQIHARLTYNPHSPLEMHMLAYDRAAHLPGRPTSRIEADEVEVEPIVELAPMLAAVNAAPETQQRAPQPHHPTRPGRSLARPALLSRREARCPRSMPRRRSAWHARTRASTLTSEQVREPPGGDVEESADRAEKHLRGGRWVEDDDRCATARLRSRSRPCWASPRASSRPKRGSYPAVLRFPSGRAPQA